MELMAAWRAAWNEGSSLDRSLVMSTPRLAASVSATSVSRKVGSDGPGSGVAVPVAVCDGSKAVGIDQEVGERDETSEMRGASVDAGDVGAALDPLRLRSEGELSALVLRGAGNMSESVEGNASRSSRQNG